jgi:hypothetical protein
MKKIVNIMSVMLLVILTGCASTKINSAYQGVQLMPSSQWGAVPLVNNTTTPQAGQQATAMMAGLLYDRGVNKVTTYQSNVSCDRLLICPSQAVSMNTIQAWARHNGIRYVMTGSVNEWRYKVGLDGEPSASITLMLHDTVTGKIIWSAVGSRHGDSRDSLSKTGQVLIDQMLNRLF